MAASRALEDIYFSTSPAFATPARLDTMGSASSSSASTLDAEVQNSIGSASSSTLDARDGGERQEDIEDPSSSALIPGYVDNYHFLHGRAPPTDANVFLVDALDVKAPENLQERNRLESQEVENDSQVPTLPVEFLPEALSTQSISRPDFLTTLPSEIIDLVLSFLGPIDLVTVSSTCHLLNSHSKSDLSWQRHVQENIPGVTLTSPAPCKTYRELYIAHDPHWFLPEYKIWFSDYFLTGKILIIRYDPRRGCIEGYRLVCERPAPTFVPWEHDDEVLIHSFAPKCRLHMDQPVIQLDAISLESLMMMTTSHRGAGRRGRRFNSETPMRINERNHHGVFSNLLLTQPVEQQYDGMELWPPQNIPARHRVRNTTQEAYVGQGHKPQKRSEVSNQSFRIRRWMEMGAGSHTPGLHLGEEIYTYATLDPKIYTPTADKPWRGIWVGDFSGHGCEFLLFHQPDDIEPFDPNSLVQNEDETPEEFALRKKESKIYRGCLEAIKLTGDPNIPRGEYTFIADDISDAALVRRATENEWNGARIVRSRGHIATRLFRNDKYIESQLILISNTRIAQYWVGFGHICFYERVDIDAFLNPLLDTKPNNVC